MNTVKHFVKISIQKLEIIKGKLQSGCLSFRHFVSKFGFVGSVTLHLKSQF